MFIFFYIFRKLYLKRKKKSKKLYLNKNIKSNPKAGGREGSIYYVFLFLFVPLKTKQEKKIIFDVILQFMFNSQNIHTIKKGKAKSIQILQQGIKESIKRYREN